MKKLMVTAGVMTLACLLTGCVSTAVENDPVAKWQKDRFASDAIVALQKENKLPSALDVSVKSSIGVKAAAAIVNTFDAPFAAGYAKVVKNADELYFKTVKGHAVYQNVADAAHDNKTSIDTEASKLPADEKKVFDEYIAYTKGLKQEDQDSTLKLIEELLNQFADGAQQVAGVGDRVKACPEFAALAGLEAVKEGKNLASDLSALKEQMASATTGLNEWKRLVEIDKAAREYAIQR